MCGKRIKRAAHGAVEDREDTLLKRVSVKRSYGSGHVTGMVLVTGLAAVRVHQFTDGRSPGERDSGRSVRSYSQVTGWGRTHMSC